MGRLVTLITVFCVFAAVTFWSVLYVAQPQVSAQTANAPAVKPLLRASTPLS
ncbi:MAG: hypothetical protein RLZZ141_394 [Pseudomonadota bacterium]